MKKAELSERLTRIEKHLGLATEEKREPKVGEWWYGESEEIHFKVKITEISNDWVRVEYYGKTHFDMRKGCVPHNCLLRPATDKEIEQALRSYVDYQKGQGYTHFMQCAMRSIGGDVSFERLDGYGKVMYIGTWGVYNDKEGWAEFIKSPQEKVIKLDGGTEVFVSKSGIKADDKIWKADHLEMLVSDKAKLHSVCGHRVEIAAYKIGCETVTIDQLKSIINAFEELQR